MRRQRAALSAHEQLKAFATRADRVFFARLREAEGPLHLLAGEKRYLLTACRVSIRDFLAQRPTSLSDFAGAPPPLTAQNAIVFVTLYCKGAIRGCWSKEGEHLLDAAIRSARGAASDARFGKPLSRLDFPDTRIELTLLTGGEDLAERDLGKLREQIELGVHGLSLGQEGKRAFFKASVPLSHGYDHQALLQQLGSKAGLGESAYARPEVRLTRYRTVEFSESFIDRFSRSELQERFRAGRVVPPSAVTRVALEDALRLCADWVHHQIDEAGQATWMLVEAGNFFDSPPFRESALRHLRSTISRYLVREGRLAYVVPQGAADLGRAASLLLALVKLPQREQFAGEISALVAFLLSMEEDRSFHLGDALTALAAVFDGSRAEELLAPAKRLFPRCRDLHRSAEHPGSMAASLSRPYRHLFALTGRDEYAQLVLQINDDCAQAQVPLDTRWPDHAGAWRPGDPRSRSTGACLESLLEGLGVAKALGDEKRARRYRECCLLGLRYLLQCQISPEEVFDDPCRASLAGGVRTSCYDHSIRADNQQHAGMAFLRAIAEMEMKY